MMYKKFIIFITAALYFILLTSSYSRADIVRLKNGRFIRGIVVRDDEKGVIIDTDIGEVAISRQDIDTIEEDKQVEEKKTAEEPQKPLSEAKLKTRAAVIEVKMPSLGKKISGASGHFSKGTFSVQDITYIKGKYFLVHSAESNIDGSKYKKIFKYGNGYFGIPDGNEHILVVICRAKFKGTIPMPQKNQSEQVVVSDENDGKFSISQEYFSNDVGSNRDYVQVHILDPQKKIPKKLKIQFFLKTE